MAQAADGIRCKSNEAFGPVFASTTAASANGDLTMPNVEVQKLSGNDKATFPLFQEFAKKFDEVRDRAFQLFEGRGSNLGHDFEDWLKAEREVMGSATAQVTDKGDVYEVQMALPGFEAKDVEVTATPDEIVIHAATTKEKKSETDKVLWSEFSSNDVYRRIPIPAALNAENTTASLDKGMLRISVPKAAAPRPIAVKTAA